MVSLNHYIVRIIKSVAQHVVFMLYLQLLFIIFYKIALGLF
jgi:hypothetical protein